MARRPDFPRRMARLIETTNVYRLQLRDMKKELFLKDQYFTGGVWKAPIGNK
jgi:hypothetical protein